MEKKNKIPPRFISAGILCGAAVILTVYLGGIFRSQKIPEPIYPGEGVTEQFMLSRYLPELEGTAGDTEVYVLDSGVEGASMLVLGGTHPNEPSGVVSAVALIEFCKPETGTLYVIPRANNSAFTCTDPQEASPLKYYIPTKNGDRWFRFGSRATNPIDQWPDSEIYIHAASGQQLSGSETRNLNRAYPGRADGNLTEQVAYAITEFIKSSDISITVDLHEASPEYTTVNAMVAHENALDTANMALWEIEDYMKIGIEGSPTNLHGLTHRELGDYTNTQAILMETANASQGRLHGVTSSDLIVSGKDKFYTRAAEYGALTVPYGPEGISISERCARHLSALNAFANNYMGDAGILSLGEFPSYQEIIDNGIGYYLADAEGNFDSSETEEDWHEVEINGQKFLTDGYLVQEPPCDIVIDQMTFSDFGDTFSETYPVSVDTYKLMEGTEYEMEVSHIQSDTPGPVIYLVGGVHGDERAGYYAGQLMKGATISCGELYVLAPVNVTGAAELNRYVGEEDLNRSFPGNAEGSPAEQIAAAVFSDISSKSPEFLLDLHEAIIYTEGRDFLGSTLIFTDLSQMGDLYFDLLFATQDGTICSQPFAESGPGPEGSINHEVTMELGIPSVTVETFRGFDIRNRVSDQLEIVEYVLEYKGMR